MWSAPSSVGCMATDFLPPQPSPSRSAAPHHASVRVHVPGAACPPAGAAGRLGGALPRRWPHTAVRMASPPSVGGSLPLYTMIVVCSSHSFWKSAILNLACEGIRGCRGGFGGFLLSERLSLRQVRLYPL